MRQPADRIRLARLDRIALIVRATSGCSMRDVIRDGDDNAPILRGNGPVAWRVSRAPVAVGCRRTLGQIHACIARVANDCPIAPCRCHESSEREGGKPCATPRRGVPHRPLRTLNRCNPLRPGQRTGRVRTQLMPAAAATNPQRYLAWPSALPLPGPPPADAPAAAPDALTIPLPWPRATPCATGEPAPPAAVTMP